MKTLNETEKKASLGQGTGYLKNPYKGFDYKNLTIFLEVHGT